MAHDMALWLILMSSNFPCLEHIFMVPKVFEPLKFDCIFHNEVGLHRWGCYKIVILVCLSVREKINSHSSWIISAYRRTNHGRTITFICSLLMNIYRESDGPMTPIYNRKPMARTPLEPWKYFRGRASSSQWELIKAPGQEAQSKYIFDFL